MILCFISYEDILMATMFTEETSRCREQGGRVSSRRLISPAAPCGALPSVRLSFWGEGAGRCFERIPWSLLGTLTLWLINYLIKAYVMPSGAKWSVWKTHAGEPALNTLVLCDVIIFIHIYVFSPDNSTFLFSVVEDLYPSTVVLWLTLAPPLVDLVHYNCFWQCL